MPIEEECKAVEALGPRVDPAWANIDEFAIRAGDVPDRFVSNEEEPLYLTKLDKSSEEGCGRACSGAARDSRRGAGVARKAVLRYM